MGEAGNSSLSLPLDSPEQCRKLLLDRLKRKSNFQQKRFLNYPIGFLSLGHLALLRMTWIDERFQMIAQPLCDDCMSEVARMTKIFGEPIPI